MVLHNFREICAWFGRLEVVVSYVFGSASSCFKGLWWGRSETSLERRVSYVSLKQGAKSSLCTF